MRYRMSNVPQHGVSKHKQSFETPEEGFVLDERRGGGGIHVRLVDECCDGVVLGRSIDCTDADE